MKIVSQIPLIKNGGSSIADANFQLQILVYQTNVHKNAEVTINIRFAIVLPNESAVYFESKNSFLKIWAIENTR
ncbi:hypothetical protein [Chryseobacterium echinoideorum]|uniref:hypothetical protein n=1 Tax=Chryseobacterium echinoideorum TaxID=1549648 RepID=UPI0011862015|nr:hypothetical protein [Chryseobacterium echinoideorum]